MISFVRPLRGSLERAPISSIQVFLNAVDEDLVLEESEGCGRSGFFTKSFHFVAPVTGVPSSLRRRLVEITGGLMGAALLALVDPFSVVEVPLSREVSLVPKINRDIYDGPLYEDLSGVSPVGGRLHLF